MTRLMFVLQVVATIVGVFIASGVLVWLDRFFQRRNKI